MLRSVLLVFAISLSLGCTPAREPPPDEQCQDACTHRRELGCLEPQFLNECVPVCLATREAGLYQPECVIRAVNDIDLLSCGVRCFR